jgi:hypothetical protein
MPRFCSALTALALLIACTTEAATKPKRSNAIHYMAPAAFPELPSSVVRELENRKCLVPQYPKTWKAPDHINVVRGEFAKTGQKDWAVVCSTPTEVSLLVFWNASDKGFAEVPLGTSDGYIVGGSVPKETLLEKYKGKLPGVVIDHDAFGITDANNRSIVRYFDAGKWIQLGGVPHDPAG